MRGLKLTGQPSLIILFHVAPHAGAWIEMRYVVNTHTETGVAPHAGAWIEMLYFCFATVAGFVAPHAGAWIEMSEMLDKRSTT